MSGKAFRTLLLVGLFGVVIVALPLLLRQQGLVEQKRESIAEFGGGDSKAEEFVEKVLADNNIQAFIEGGGLHVVAVFGKDANKARELLRTGAREHGIQIRLRESNGGWTSFGDWP
jgi:hypothetical protein